MMPVFQRELRIQSRSAFQRYARVAAGAFLALVLLVMWGLNRHLSGPVLGLFLFRELSDLLGLMALLGSVVWVADTLSRDFRDGMMPLLFLTPLRPVEIVLGKVGGGVLRGLGWVLAAVPVLAIPLLMGGVGLGMVYQTAIWLTGLVFLGLACGLVGSARSRSGGGALAMGCGLMALILGLQGWLAMLGVGDPWVPWLHHRTQPSGVGQAVAGSNMNGLGGVGLLCVVGLMGVAVVWIVRRRMELDLERAGTAGRWNPLWHYVPPGLRGWQQWRRRRLLARNPLEWLSYRSPVQVLQRGIWMAWIAALWTAELSTNAHSIDSFPWAGLFEWVLLFAATFVAAAGLREERRTGALELLLVSGLTSRQLVRSVVARQRRTFLPPACVVAVMELWARVDPDGFGRMTSAGSGQGLGLVAAAWSLPAIGLACSLFARTTVGGFFLTAVWGWAGLLGLVIVVRAAGMSGPWGIGMDLAMAVNVWVAGFIGHRTARQLLETRTYSMPSGVG